MAAGGDRNPVDPLETGDSTPSTSPASPLLSCDTDEDCDGEWPQCRPCGGGADAQAFVDADEDAPFSKDDNGFAGNSLPALLGQASTVMTSFLSDTGSSVTKRDTGLFTLSNSSVSRSQSQGTQTTLQAVGGDFRCAACARPPPLPSAFDGAWTLALGSVATKPWLKHLLIKGLTCTDALGRSVEMRPRGEHLALKNRTVTAMGDDALAISDRKAGMLVYKRAEESAAQGAQDAEGGRVCLPRKQAAHRSHQPQKADASTQTALAGCCAPLCPCERQERLGFHLLDGVWEAEEPLGPRSKLGSVLRICGAKVIDGFGQPFRMTYFDNALMLKNRQVMISPDRQRMALLKREEDQIVFSRIGSLR